MEKTWLYRLFGIGKIPAKLRSELQQEGLLLAEEGIPGSATFLNFHKPGMRASWRRQWYTASLALTRTRLVALRYGSPIINVPLNDERIRSMQYLLEANGGVLCVSFDVTLFHPDWSGQIEYRFRTAQAGKFIDLLQQWRDWMN